MGVAPRGRAISRPRGVKQNTWSWNSSSLVYSRKSSVEDAGGQVLDGLAQRREGLALALDAVEVVGDALLVEGVGGDAVLGDAVHLLGADLQLGALAAEADDGRVDRAVVVVLGDRDVVLEAAGHDLPVGVDDAERAVAVGDRRHDDAEADHVGELLERDLLALDLGGDRPRRLHPRRDLARRCPRP